MKLNNKGFAITAVLYGLLILFVVLVSSYLLVLAAKKDRIDDLVNDIENDYVIGDSCINFSNNTLAEYIYNLYVDSEKIEVIHNDITYHYAVSVGLMNDRMGKMSTNIDCGNIRYYGTDPNNYIYFNCSDYSKQSDYTCEKWRIIGIVDGKVKIIKNSSIGEFVWDDNNKNDWNSATLNSYLNNDYYNMMSDNTKSLISLSNWFVSNVDDPELYANEIYQIERKEGNVLKNNIALLYPSDYGYSVNLNQCDKTVYYYEEGCVMQSWMKNLFINEETKATWLLMTSSDNLAFYLDKIGAVNIYIDDLSIVTSKNNTIPTLYLDTNLNINSVGDGTEDNPYQLIVN